MVNHMLVINNLSNQLWISQISGLIGLIIIGISYLFPKKKYLLFASLSFIFFILETVFAKLYANLIVTSVCLIRNLLMTYYLFRKNKEVPMYIVISLLVIMWIGEVAYMRLSNTFNVFDNYLPPLLVTMSTFTQNSKNEYVVKMGAALHETGFLIYYSIYKLPLSIFRQIILVFATFIGIILLKIKNRIEKIKN